MDKPTPTPILSGQVGSPVFEPEEVARMRLALGKACDDAAIPLDSSLQRDELAKAIIFAYKPDLTTEGVAVLAIKLISPH